VTDVDVLVVGGGPLGLTVAAEVADARSRCGLGRAGAHSLDRPATLRNGGKDTSNT
jgi:flavin-dependent dehydrogenase